MDPNYVPDLLRSVLAFKESELEKRTQEIDSMRSKMTTSTNKRDYIWLKKDLDSYEESRRELRGQVSALRQAIKKLEREE